MSILPNGQRDKNLKHSKKDSKDQTQFDQLPKPCDLLGNELPRFLFTLTLEPRFTSDCGVVDCILSFFLQKPPTMQLLLQPLLCFHFCHLRSLLFGSKLREFNLMLPGILWSAVWLPSTLFRSCLLRLEVNPKVPKNADVHKFYTGQVHSGASHKTPATDSHQHVGQMQRYMLSLKHEKNMLNMLVMIHCRATATDLHNIIQYILPNIPSM